MKIDIKIKYFLKTKPNSLSQDRGGLEKFIYSTCSVKQITAGEYLCEADKLQNCLASWSHGHPFHSLCLSRYHSAVCLCYRDHFWKHCSSDSAVPLEIAGNILGYPHAWGPSMLTHVLWSSVLLYKSIDGLSHTVLLEEEFVC